MGKLDRKLSIEESIIYLIQNGYPVDLVEKDPKYMPYLDVKMSNQLERSYNHKVLALIERYIDFGSKKSSQDVADSYTEVYRPVGGEEYPLTQEEETELFKRRDEYRKKLDELKIQKTSDLKKQKEELELLKKEYEKHFPFIEKMNTFTEKMNELKDNNDEKIVTEKQVCEEFSKMGLFPEHIDYYKEKYELYSKLVDKLDDVSLKYNNAIENGDIEYDKSMRELKKEIDKIHNELVLKNSRLIDAFIRKNYRDLLVEQNELYSICYMGLWEAIRDFDYTKGFSFSTYAYACIDMNIKNNFKSLTKYKWEDYWSQKKINLLLREATEVLGRNATVFDLFDAGLLDMSDRLAKNYVKMVQEYSCSELLDMVNDNNKNEDYVDDEMDEYYDIEKFGEDDIFSDINRELENYELREKLEEIFKTIPERSVMILKYRFGLDGYEWKSRGEVAEIFDLSPGRIAQIENKTMLQLRQHERASKLEPFI